MTFLGFVLEASSFLKTSQWTSFCSALLSKDDPQFQPSLSAPGAVFFHPVAGKVWAVPLPRCDRKAVDKERNTTRAIQTPSSLFPSSTTIAGHLPEPPAAEVSNYSADSEPDASDPVLQTAWMLQVRHEKLSQSIGIGCCVIFHSENQ